MFQFNYNKLRKNNKLYLIAEIGVNHECSLSTAKKLILYAKRGGANAAKFQTYKAEKITSKFSKAYWDLKKENTKSQFELFSKYDLFEEEDYRKLANFCKKIKIDFLSTPFDLEAVDFLNSLVPAFKISSSDITNYPLLKKIASKRKPVLLSTGASNLKEIKNAINYLKKNGSKKIVIMHCILNYPTKDFNANLNMIQHLKREFPNFVMGYSDHTLPDKNMNNLTAAYILGAKVIEKHFTLNKKLKGNDHYHSMDLKDLKVFTTRLNQTNILLGNFDKKKILKSELIARKNARRSIVLKRDAAKGQVLKKQDLICKRPGTGISPVKLNKVLGKKLRYDLDEDHILTQKDFI